MAERNKIKLKKTRGGASQYGSTEDFQKHYDRLFNKFINDGSASDSDLLEKMNRLKAGKYATRSYDEDGSFEKQQMEFAEEKAKQRRKRPVNKKYGGKVTKMKEGGFTHTADLCGCSDRDARGVRHSPVPSEAVNLNRRRQTVTSVGRLPTGAQM